jgi:hypothetical protein
MIPSYETIYNPDPTMEITNKTSYAVKVKSVTKSSQTKGKHKRMTSAELIPLNRAAEIFASKIPSLNTAEGRNEIAYEAFVDRLSKVTAGNLGVLPIYVVADLLEINRSTLHSNASEKRYNKFPAAVSSETEPATEQPKSGGYKLLSMFHPDFVSWYESQYKPRVEKKICRLNSPDVLFQAYKYTERSEDGGSTITKVALNQGCSNLVARSDHFFCSEQTHGMNHYRIWCKIKDVYAKNGALGRTGKGPQGPKELTPQEYTKQKKALNNGELSDRARKQLIKLNQSKLDLYKLPDYNPD